MESRIMQMPAYESQAIETYKLIAKPSPISEGRFKGELRSVAFTATSATETVRWSVINCGQFERAFSKIISRGLAAEMVDALVRGEDIEFPGEYQRTQFDGGFHYEWAPVFSDLTRSYAVEYAVEMEAEMRI